MPILGLLPLPLTVGRSRIDQTANHWQKRRVLRFLIAPTRLGVHLQTGVKVRARHPECLCDAPHRVASLSGEALSKVGFFARVRSSASLRISASMVLRPSRRSSSRTRSSRRRTSEAHTTPSSALKAATPPSAVSRRQRYSRLAATPRRRATAEMLSPLWWLSSTMRSFCSAVHRRRRGVPVMISTRW